MAETLKEHSELRLMPMKTLPVKVPTLLTAEERLMTAIEDFVNLYGRPVAYVALLREAARIKHDDEKVIERLSAWSQHEG